MASREILEQQQEFKGSIDKIRAADGLALAAGDMETSLLLADGLPEAITASDLIDAGAVGDIVGYFLKADGSLVDHDINARVLGIKLTDLDDLPNVVVAAGGAKKVPIMRAILLSLMSTPPAICWRHPNDICRYRSWHVRYQSRSSR